MGDSLFVLRVRRWVLLTCMEVAAPIVVITSLFEDGTEYRAMMSAIGQLLAKKHKQNKGWEGTFPSFISLVVLCL